MKKIFYHTLIFYFIIFSSCKEGAVNKTETKSGLPQINIYPLKGKLPYLKLSEIAKDIRYVKLETNKNALISYGITHYSDSSEYFIIEDKRHIFVFDKSGKFIRKIGRIGRGPNEFVPHKIAVDFKKEILYVNTLGNHKILRFDFRGMSIGELKNDIIDIHAKMALLKNQLVLVNAINQFTRQENKSGFMEIFTLDVDSGKIGTYLPNRYHIEIDKRFFGSSISGQEQLQIANNTGYYKMRFCDTLYRI